MKKRKYIILGIVVFCAIILSVYYSANIPIAQNIDHLEINRIVTYSDKGDASYITNSVDIDSVKEIVAQYNCKLHTTSFAPYSLSKVRYELNCSYNGKPLHILLGDLSIAYEDSSHGGHCIVDSDELLLRIEQCISNIYCK